MEATQAIVTLGHPILRQAASPIIHIGTNQVQQLIDQLMATAEDADGVGIAAPQVGYPWQLLIIASRPNGRYPYAPTMEPTALINPRLVAHSDDRETGWEGCLSVPGLRGRVPRYRQVEVEYLDRWGNPRRQVWQDFVARIFQHEYDHLNGHVFLDRVESDRDLIVEEEFQRLIIAGEI